MVMAMVTEQNTSEGQENRKMDNTAVDKKRMDGYAEIDLLSLFFFLLGKWKLLILGAVLGGAVAAGLTVRQTPMYRSSSTLYVLSRTTDTTSMSDLQLGSALISDFAEIAASKPVIETAIGTLEKEENISLTPEQVKSMMSVSNKTDTRLLVISVVSDDAQLSCLLTEALTSAAADQMANITQTDKPKVVSYPEVADRPLSNNLIRNTEIGILLALMLIGGIYTVIFIVNDNIHTEEDVNRYLETSVLGIVPVDKELEKITRSENKDKRHNNKKKKKIK